MQEKVTVFVTTAVRKIKCEMKLSYIDTALAKAHVSLSLSNTTASAERHRSEKHGGKISRCSLTPLLCLVVSQLFFSRSRRVFGPRRLWLQMTSLHYMAFTWHYLTELFHSSEWEDNIFKQQT